MSEEKPQIQYEDFAKLDIRLGKVLAAEMVPDADKLVKCTIDFGLKPSAKADGSALNGTSGEPEALADHPQDGLGEREIRTIVSGIAEWKKPEELVGKTLPYVFNLAPRMLRGVESQGMLLAASDADGVVLIQPERTVVPGIKLR